MSYGPVRSVILKEKLTKKVYICFCSKDPKQDRLPSFKHGALAEFLNEMLKNKLNNLDTFIYKSIVLLNFPIFYFVPVREL